MGFLFGRSEIKGDERLNCLAFLEEVTKLMIFEENEIKLHEEMKTKWSSSKSSKASRKMLETHYRMYQAASRLSDTVYRSYFTYSEQDNDYHIKSSVPSIASKCLIAWRMAFDYLLGAASRTYRTWSTIAEGEFSLPPPEVQEFLIKSAMYRTEAINEMNNLFKRLKLSDEGKTDIHTNAAKAVDSEKWYPYW